MAEHNQQFDSFTQWVNKGSHWLMRRHPDRAVCFDSIGRVCANGGDFMRARDESTFPVHYLWPDQIAKLAITHQGQLLDIIHEKDVDLDVNL